MSDIGTLDAAIAERKAEGRKFEQNAEQARALSSKIEDMRKDLARLQKRHDAFTEIGDDHVESAFESYDQRFNTMIQWQPMRSILSGHQLAARVKVNLEHLRGEIAKSEAEIERLLASGKKR